MEVVELLLGTGADANISDLDGDTPLHFCESVDMADLILLSGADIFKLNNNGESVLDKSIEEGNEEMVTYWTSHGVCTKESKKTKKTKS
jgi:ankyrin repeat protein